MHKSSPSQAIGIFDSGIGGLSVTNAIMQSLPHEDIVYIGDVGRMPYGPQPISVIAEYSIQITKFLLAQNCKSIVVACNTATAAALEILRQRWPKVPFIGMEPAVKPATERTQTNIVGVMATQGTFMSQRYESLARRYAKDVTLVENPCLGLVPLIEAGEEAYAETKQLLQTILSEMMAQNADQIVLGCTHYPFILPLIQEIVPDHVGIINPAPAVARQLAKRLAENNLLNPQTQEGQCTFYSTGSTASMQWAVQQICQKEELSIQQIKL